MDGILLIDKPAGITSHDVVAVVKRALKGAKVGHAGTLDPFATGLLIVLVGTATKAQRRFMELPKRYETVARLGATSSTGDTEGEISITGRLPPDPPPLPTGEVRQRPPRHSAVKIGGVRAYKRARRGEEFEMPERVVTVYRFEQLWRETETTPEPEPTTVPSASTAPGGPTPALEQAASTAAAGPMPTPKQAASTAAAGPTPTLERAGYAIECSAGTYIRSLIADLGDGYCVELRRTAIGPFEVTDAFAPPPRGEPWDQLPLIALDQALATLPK